MTLHERRPFNLRYVVRQPIGPDPEKRRCTHGTALCNYAYIMRENAVDEYGPTPDFSARADLVASGRAGPVRSLKPVWAGRDLWLKMDRLSLERRPDQATAAHMVGSLPIGETVEGWRQIVLAFVEDEIAARGMIADWAIHFQAGEGGAPGIRPHVHILATLRTFDRDPGRRNIAWFGSERQVRAAAERWSRMTGLWPSPLASAA